MNAAFAGSDRRRMVGRTICGAAKNPLADATAWWHDLSSLNSIASHSGSRRLQSPEVVDHPPLSVVFARTNGMVYGFSRTSRCSIMGLEQLNWEAL
jgi:hypothetical protein